MTVAPWTRPEEPKLPEAKEPSKYRLAISDQALATIHRTPVSEPMKAEMAEGMIDGASRYLDGEGSVPAVVSKTVN